MANTGNMTLTMRRAVPAIVLVVALILIGALLLAAEGTRASPDPPAAGDWTIGPGEDVAKASQTVTVAGNLTVRSGGRLTLTDCDLRLDMPRSGAYHVRVETGGELMLDGGTTVDSTDVDMYYNITVLGRASIGPATIRRLDGTTAPTPLSDPPGGLLLRSSDIRLHNTTVELSAGFAIAVDPPSMLTSVSPLIEDCVVRGNGGGIYCEGLILASGDPVVRRTHFYGNYEGEALVIAAAPRFEGCTFGQLLSFSLMGVSAVALAEPVLTDCTFQYLGAAIASVMASPTVDGCAVSWCGAGAVVLGGSPTIARTAFTNCIATMMLNSTTAVVRDCQVASTLTLDYAVSIDAGSPRLTNVTVDLDLIGGAVSIVNESEPVLERCHLSGTGGVEVVHIEGGLPAIRGCTVLNGYYGINISWSEAIIEDTLIQDWGRWGIYATHRAPQMSNVTYIPDEDIQGGGRYAQLYELTVWVMLSEGGPADGASFAIAEFGDIFATPPFKETTVGPDGFAYTGLLSQKTVYRNGWVNNHVYSLDASRVDRRNHSSVKFIDSDIELTIILWPNRAPTLEIVLPEDDGILNAWDYEQGINIHCDASDPERDECTYNWSLDGDSLEDGGYSTTVFPEPGNHTITILVDDGNGHLVSANATFTIVSEPPDAYFVRITSPLNGSVLPHEGTIRPEWGCHVVDTPYLPGKLDTLETAWELDGEPVELDADGMLGPFEWGTHTLTAKVVPRFPAWFPEPFTDTISFKVLPPPPEAVAVIASPEDGSVTREDLAVALSANGSHVKVFNGTQFAIVYTWRSSIDGVLGTGEEFNVSGLSVGLHRITLELTTEPPIASANASITIGIFPGPPPNIPPVAVAALASEGRLYAGDPVNFTANGSLDPDGDALMFTWDFGDGNTSTGRDVNHTYARVGTYNVTLSVTDGRATTNATVVDVLIEARKGPPPPPSDGDGDGGDHTTKEDATGCIVLVLLVAVLVALLVLTFRRRGHRA